MAVEIRELVIQAKILEDGGETAGFQSGSVRISDQALRDAKDEILKKCEHMIQSAFDNQRAR